MVRSPLSPLASAAGRERLLVWLIAVHSLAVGAMLLFAPGWSVRFAGWEGAEPLFFPRQAGAFHFVVVFAYLYEHYRMAGVRVLVFTKALAFVFLVGAWLFGEVAWSVPFSGFADGAMGLAAWLAHRSRIRGQSTDLDPRSAN